MKKLIAALLLVVAGTLAVAEEKTLMSFNFDVQAWQKRAERPMTPEEHFTFLCDMYNLDDAQRTFAFAHAEALRVLFANSQLSLGDVVNQAIGIDIRVLPHEQERIIDWIAAQFMVHTILDGWTFYVRDNANGTQ